MSFKLPKAFISALRDDEDLIELLGADDEGKGARIFSVGRSDIDEQEDKVPYLIVMPQGITTDGSKDDYSMFDTCTISILAVASSYPDLIDIAEKVREDITAVLEYDEDFVITDYSFSADAVQFDPNKPCYFQTLTYIVNTQVSI